MPSLLTHDARQVLAYLGILIAEYPEEVRQLLQVHDVELPTGLNDKALVNQVLYEIGLKNKAFQHDLAQLINLVFNTENSDSFTGNLAVPTDPVSAVAGALGSIGNIFSQAQKNKLYKQEARAQTYSNLLAYQSMKKQLAAQERKREQEHQSKKMLLQIVGIVTVAGIGLWLFIKS